VSKSPGVHIGGSAGVGPGIGLRLPGGLIPVASNSIGGLLTIGLKPGLVVVAPVDKIEFTGPNPRVIITGFHVKIDGCVGQSFIRSYAKLTQVTDESHVVLSYVGVTKPSDGARRIPAAGRR